MNVLEFIFLLKNNDERATTMLGKVQKETDEAKRILSLVDEVNFKIHSPTPQHGQPPLTIAAQEGNEGAVEALMKIGADYHQLGDVSVIVAALMG
jgi:hypothetical protein